MKTKHKRAYKYRFYPTDGQKRVLARTFGCTRFVYNWALRLRTDAYFKQGEKLCAHDLSARCVLYARVSSVLQEQDGNLGRQTERLREAASERGYGVVQVITEHASSLNERRKAMKRLLALVEQQAVDVVLIEYPDRLVRFGFPYLDQAFSWKNVQLEVLDPPKIQEPTEELIQDLLTIVTVCAGRLYGHRAKGVRKRVETVRKRMRAGRGD
jgi:putative resolvase